MINLLIKFLFFIVNSLYVIIFSPIISIIDTLLPVDLWSYILTFVNYSLTYISTITGLFLIPVTALSILFTYIEAKYLFIIVLRASKLFMNLFEKLKP